MIVLTPIAFDSPKQLEESVDAATIQMQGFPLFPSIFDDEKSDDDEYTISARKALNLQTTTKSSEMPKLEPYSPSAVSALRSSSSVSAKPVLPMPTSIKAAPTASVHKRRKKLKDSLGVKRPMNPYCLFQLSVRQKVLEEFPGLAFSDMSRKVGELWANLTYAEKQPFVEVYDKLMKEYYYKKRLLLPQNKTKSKK